MSRRTLLAALAAGSLVIAACGGDDDTSTPATDAPTPTDAGGETTDDTSDDTGDDVVGGGNECTAGNTLNDGALVIATGEPAFPPYVIDDDPESKEGFEAAVAYAVAAEMGFADDDVSWVRTTFEQAIQPGPKDYDFNLQQYSIRPERAEVVSFSDPYYTSNQAVATRAGSAAVGATTIDELRELRFGAQVGTTSLDFIVDVIDPVDEPSVYDDNSAAIAALQADQIDAIMLDLPTALFAAAVQIDEGTVIGQFPLQAGGTPDELGLVFELDNPLVECANAALAALRESGELQEITDTWMITDDVAPVIAVD